MGTYISVENGRILAAADWEFPHSERTLRTVTRDHNGELCFADAIPPKDLEYLKKESISYIKNNYNDAEKHGKFLSSLGFHIDANQLSASRLRNLLDISSKEKSISFIDAENSSHNVTYEELSILYHEILQYLSDAFAQKQTLIEKITNCSDKETLEEIRIQEGILDALPA